MFNKRFLEIQELLDNSDPVYYTWVHSKSYDQLDEIKTRLFRELDVVQTLRKTDSINEIKETIIRIEAIQELQMLIEELERINKEEQDDDPVGGYTLV